MPNAILNVGQTGGQVNISTAAAPATPAVGVVTLYAGTDKALHALNSDGTDITIAAASAASPITKVGTSLIATGVGATGGTGATTNAIAIGATATASAISSTAIGTCARATAENNVAIGTNSLSCGGYLDQGGIAIGSNACATTYVGVAIGASAKATNQDTVAIGRVSCATAASTVAVGFAAVNTGIYGTVIGGQAAQNSGSEGIAIGTNAINSAQGGIAISSTTVSGTQAIAIGYLSCSTGNCGIALGSAAKSTAACAITMGAASTVFTGATGTIVLGSSSNGGTGACNSVVIGNQSRVRSKDSVVIGLNASDGGDPLVEGIVAIGKNACVCCYAGYGQGISIGQDSKSIGPWGLTIGYLACSGSESVAVGRQANASGAAAVAIGHAACATAAFTFAFGRNSVASHSSSIVLGLGLSSIRTDTTHVNSLVAFGQAASITNAVGSTGGSVTLDWNNSNIQTLTLTSNITTLTKSNPIDGAVYTLFLTQGASGGYTVAWGADVEWAGGTGPTLSTAAGSVDAVSLVYIAGVTGYYGNANLNFS